MKFNCGNCGGVVTASQKTYQCEECKAIIFKKFSGLERSEETIIKLFNKETVVLPVEWNGKPGIPKAHKYDFENMKLMTFFQAKEKVANFSCGCGGTVGISGSIHSCKSCKLTIWQTIARVKLTDESLEALFNNQRVYVKGLAGANGGKFNAWIAADYNKKTTRYEYDEAPALCH